MTPHGLFKDVHAGTEKLLIGISDCLNSCLLDLACFVPNWRVEILGGVI